MKNMILSEDRSLDIHPNWFTDVPGMKTLILGSFPPHEDRRDYQFYYPNKINRFWKILANIANSPLEYFEGQQAVDERISLMNKLQIGVENLGKIIERKGKSAKDSDIKILEFHDIMKLIKEHNQLKTILLPGLTGESSTYHLFMKYLKLNGVNIDSAPLKPKGGQVFEIQVDQKYVTCIAANSTSTLARRVKYEDLVRQFRLAVE